jgi:transposase
VRELVFLVEHHAQRCAKALLELLLEMKCHVEAAKWGGQSALSSQALSFYEQRCDWIADCGMRENPAPFRQPNQRGRLKQSSARNLLDRLHSHKAQVLAFLHDFVVPFDNNLAERDNRMVKVQQKVSGGFRSANGAYAFCHLRSYILTARKNGQSVLTSLFRAFVGVPYLPYCMASLAPD